MKTVYFFPDDGWVDGYGLTLALLTARTSYGLEVRQGVPVEAIESAPDGTLRVAAGKGCDSSATSS